MERLNEVLFQRDNVTAIDFYGSNFGNQAFTHSYLHILESLFWFEIKMKVDFFILKSW